MLRRRTLVNNNEYDGPIVRYITSSKTKISNLTGLNNSDVKDHVSIGEGYYEIRLYKDINVSLGNNFLSNTDIVEIYFINCQNITSIGTYFLSNNGFLIKVDLSSLTEVKSVGQRSFNCCWLLEELDISPLVNCESFGCLITDANISLSTYNLKKLITYKSYISSFNIVSSILEEIYCVNEIYAINLYNGFDITRFKSNLKIFVPHKFVETYKERFPELADRIYCILKEECSEHFEWPIIDYPAIMYTTTNEQPLSLGISGETGQEKIGRCFVHKFPSETITIPNSFLQNNLQLERIKFNKVKHSAVSTIPSYFAYGWQNCKDIDLSPFSHCTQITNYCLYGNVCLEKLDLSPLSNCTSLGLFFMGYTYCKTDIDFSPLSKIPYSQLASKNLFGYNLLPNIDLRNDWGKDLPNGYIFSNSTMFSSSYFLINLYWDYKLIRAIASSIKNGLSKNSGRWMNEEDYINKTGYSGEIHDPYIYIYGIVDEILYNVPLSSAFFDNNTLPGVRLYVEHSEYSKWLNRDINYTKWVYCMDFPDGIINYESTKAFNDVIVNIPYNSIFKEKCDYKVIAVVNGELRSLIYHYEEGDTPGHVIANEQGVGVSIFAPVDLNNSTYFSFSFDSYRDITSLYIRCVEPLKYAINWRDISWHWYSLNNSDAIYGVQYICNSPGTNSMAKIRCDFSGLKSITFTFRSDAETNYDYLIVGQVDTDLGNVITTWTASSVYNNVNVVASTRGKQGQWLTYTFNTDANEHFVDFIFGKDSSTDTQPDNAQVYVSAITQ